MKSVIRKSWAQIALPLALLGTAPVIASPANATTTQAQQFAQARIHIPSMTCSNHSCATTVYLSLIRLPGVMGVNIDEATQNVTVKYLPTKARPETFLHAVKNAGYPGTLVSMRQN